MLLEEIKNIKSTDKELRDFGLVVGGALLLLAAFLWYKGRPSFPYIGGVGLLLFILGFVVPKLLIPLQKVWMVFAVIMGFIMTRLIVTVLFYGIMTPIGLGMRLFGKDLIDKKLDEGAESYWRIREGNDRMGEEVEPSRYERQF